MYIRLQDTYYTVIGVKCIPTTTKDSVGTTLP